MRIIGAVIVSLFTELAIAQAGSPPKEPPGVVVIQVSYYAKPGKADEVFAHRQHVSDLLERLGLPGGRVLRRAGSSSDQPDVMWECEYSSAAALDQALKSAQGNPEFEEARKYMGTLILKGERRDWEVPGAQGRQH
jgi:hypothetical protein